MQSVLFDEFEEEYPELQSYKLMQTSLERRGQNKNLRNLQENYDMNDSHYIIFEADGPEGKE